MEKFENYGNTRRVRIGLGHKNFDLQMWAYLLLE